MKEKDRLGDLCISLRADQLLRFDTLHECEIFLILIFIQNFIVYVLSNSIEVATTRKICCKCKCIARENICTYF